jgi:predicted regulator of Ras-like GTPase activity (Roadblock/LC7/MglB family)
MVFSDVLEEVSEHVEGSIGYVVMGMDGIPIERLIADRRHNFDMIATESTSLLRNTQQASEELGAGPLRELSFTNDQFTVLAVAITEEYILLGALSKGSNYGKARFYMKRAALRLEKEFV